jgi:hypothetical protein
VLILKGDKVICFDTLSEVLILKLVRDVNFDPLTRIDSKRLTGKAAEERTVWKSFPRRILRRFTWKIPYQKAKKSQTKSEAG